MNRFVTVVLRLLRKFCIVKGRQTVKNILKKCFICKYFKGKILLGPATPCLTDFTVKCNHSFEFVVWILRDQFITNLKTVYLKLMFYCLRRFFAKRGKTKLVISDNFQTFKSKKLKIF